MCAYGNGKGIKIGKVAEIATISFGEGEFKPDPGLLRLYNLMQGTLKRKTKVYNNNEGLVEKVIPLLRGLIKTGHKYLPNIKELAEMFSVKYDSLKKHFPEIKSKLQRYNYYINYNYSKKKYEILTYGELIKFAFERKKPRDNYINLDQKVIHRSECQIDCIVLVGPVLFYFSAG